MARPFSFTKEKADRLIEMIQAGATQEQAARAVGVTRSTLLRWLREGREGVPKFADFARDYGDHIRPSRRGRSEDVWEGPSDAYEAAPPQESTAYKRPVRVAPDVGRLMEQCRDIRDELNMLQSNAEAQYQAAQVHQDYLRHELGRLNRSVDALLDAVRGADDGR